MCSGRLEIDSPKYIGVQRITLPVPLTPVCAHRRRPHGVHETRRGPGACVCGSVGTSSCRRARREESSLVSARQTVSLRYEDW